MYPGLAEGALDGVLFASVREVVEVLEAAEVLEEHIEEGVGHRCTTCRSTSRYLLLYFWSCN